VKRRRWSAAALVIVLGFPFGQGMVSLAHAALDHDHDDHLHHALETALHGHAHEEATPAHEHSFARADQDPALRVRASGGLHAAAAVTTPEPASAGPEWMRYYATVAAHGAGPPSISRRSPVLRI